MKIYNSNIKNLTAFNRLLGFGLVFLDFVSRVASIIFRQHHGQFCA